MHLRPVAAAEVEAVQALAAHPDVAPFLAPHTADRLRAALEDPDKELLAIEVAGALAGALRLDRPLWEPHRIVELRSLLVDPARRGQGIGVGALRALLARETALGTHRIQAEAYGFNTGALRTFEAAGFVREGTRRAAWLRDGIWRDGAYLGWVAPDHAS